MLVSVYEKSNISKVVCCLTRTVQMGTDVQLKKTKKHAVDIVHAVLFISYIMDIDQEADYYCHVVAYCCCCCC